MLKKLVIFLSIIVTLFIASHIIRFYNSQTIYGVTFNDEFARYLQLDPRQVYSKILYDWGFKHIRLSAQWNSLEPKSGEYNFSELDWQMDEAAKAGAKVVLAVGQKTPRWPECHSPTWTVQFGDQEYYQKLRDFMAVVVKRYARHPALETWQIENEPFLDFGVNCRSFTTDELASEIATVKRLDSDHQIIITDSGELSSWRQTAGASDLFGTTMYRVVWNKYTGYFNYDWIPAIFYRLKLWLNGRPVNTAYVVELQAEPWINDNDLVSVPLADQYRSMNLKRLQKNVNFAASTGMPRVYLWGAEWWYWLDAKGESEIPNFIKTLGGKE